jgi:hypothetical protein
MHVPDLSASNKAMILDPAMVSRGDYSAIFIFEYQLLWYGEPELQHY